jgi:hypothetical protein
MGNLIPEFEYRAVLFFAVSGVVAWGSLILCGIIIAIGF